MYSLYYGRQLQLMFIHEIH